MKRHHHLAIAAVVLVGVYVAVRYRTYKAADVQGNPGVKLASYCKFWQYLMGKCPTN